MSDIRSHPSGFSTASVWHSVEIRVLSRKPHDQGAKAPVMAAMDHP